MKLSYGTGCAKDRKWVDMDGSWRRVTGVLFLGRAFSSFTILSTHLFIFFFVSPHHGCIYSMGLFSQAEWCVGIYRNGFRINY